MRTRFIVAGIALALFCLPGMVQADWLEYFDVYANDSGIDGQGGWELWPGGQNGFVRDDFSQTSPHSLEVGPNADCVRQYFGAYTTGRWLFKTWVYVPGDLTGDNYLIMLSGYDGGGAGTTWAVQSRFRGLTGTFNCQCGHSTEVVGPELLFDTWVPVWVFIDLDEDWTQVYYNGVLLDSDLVADHPTYGGGYPWTEGVFGGEANNAEVAAIDLFSDNASPIYWDTLKLLNGENSFFDLSISTSPRVRFEYEIYPGSDWNIDSDTWFVAFTPHETFGILSYTMDGPLMGFEPGLVPLASGSFGPSFGVALDVPGMPAAWQGDYTVHLGVDTIGNGSPDLGNLWDMETINFSYP